MSVYGTLGAFEAAKFAENLEQDVAAAATKSAGSFERRGPVRAN
jgi:hypothetical protein